MDQVRNCIINSFYKTIPYSRFLVWLSILDDIILKINCNVIENISENIHDLRDVLYMLTVEKLVNDEPQTVKQQTDEQQTDKTKKKTLVTWWDYEIRCPRSILVNNSESENRIQRK